MRPVSAAVTTAAMWAVAACAGPVAEGARPAPAAMPAADTSAVVSLIRAAARPITGSERDYDTLIAMVGDARFVLLGDATHGTSEFYTERARITRRLIEEKGFTAVAIEGDWPWAERVHRHVHGAGGDPGAAEALGGFLSDFPQWMWGSAEVAELVTWLRGWNQRAPHAARVGFYGLDVYTLYPSAQAVERYLAGADTAAAARARQRYRCFAAFGHDPQRYGAAAAVDPRRSCAAPARQVREELEQRYSALPAAGGDPAAADALFSALRNARVVENAEEYFRTLYEGGTSTWNLRDQHMAEGLEQLGLHLARQGKPPRVVVWAHNTHAGDARVTQQGAAGELNLGHLMRERYDGAAFLVGFTTYTGTVLAASEWGEAGRVRNVRPALPESFAGLFHRSGVGNFLLPLRGTGSLADALAAPRLERAIGVLYLPETERASHYFLTRLSRQFDVVVHIDTTRAVRPLPAGTTAARGETFDGMNGIRASAPRAP